MQPKLLAIMVGVTTLLLVVIVWVRHSREEDTLKHYLAEGVRINEYFANETQTRWGNQSINLHANTDLPQIIRKAMDVLTSPSTDEIVIESLVLCVVDFLATYSDGRFDALKNYRLRQSNLVDPDLIAMQSVRAKDSLAAMKRSVATPLVSHPSQLAEPRHVKWSVALVKELGELYTNRIMFSLVNDIATSAYKELGDRVIAESPGAELLARIDHSVSHRLREIEHSPTFYAFIAPWERLSSQLLSMQVFNTNGLPNGFAMNSRLLGGLHRNVTERLFFHQPSPAEIVEEQGEVLLAVLQTAVKPLGLDYYGPITAVWFYDPQQETWRLYQFVCHAQIAASVPF